MYSLQIEKAIQAACVLHDGQTRKGKVAIPYVSHVFSVANIVADYSDDELIIVAALLHDTLEDTEYTAAALEEDFGPEVLARVQAVSEDKTITNWEVRKQDYLKKVVAGDEPALLISAADKIHNMRSMIDEYHDDVAGYLRTFSRYHTKGEAFLTRLHDALNHGLKNDIVHEFNHVFTEFKKFNEHVSQAQKSN
jgi:(p)ppGpp synthase/HD superfamily hydrolase